MNTENIQLKIKELIAGAGMESHGFPVRLEPLADSLGFKINVFNPDKKTAHISGAIFRDKNLILVNGKDSVLRQRFTIAHEIAHIKLHESDNNFIDYRRIDQYDEEYRKKEIEADEFAARLLMPEESFITKWNEFDGDIKQLSAYFGTSMPSVGVRISKLGLDR